MFDALMMQAGPPGGARASPEAPSAPTPRARAGEGGMKKGRGKGGRRSQLADEGRGRRYDEEEEEMEE